MKGCIDLSMKRNKLAVIGVGNMANAIISGALSSDCGLSNVVLYDVNKAQTASLCSSYPDKVSVADSIKAALESADSVLISVKPQNYPEVICEMSKASGYADKLYISIGAGISTESVKEAFGDKVLVVRVLPNLPMLIGMGVSVICRNSEVDACDFDFVKKLFACAGGILEIEEEEMNRIIGVTSSSPAYVFKFIDAVYNGAVEQGLSEEGLLDAICDMVIGSAAMVKQSDDSPALLASRVASKGGTTEKALEMLEAYKFSDGIKDAMKACTKRADELGAKK